MEVPLLLVYATEHTGPYDRPRCTIDRQTIQREAEQETYTERQERRHKHRHRETEIEERDTGRGRGVK